MTNDGDDKGPVLEVHGLTKVYPGAAAPALDGLDLTVHPGEIVGLLGPNGAGKTTAISIMSTLLRPTAGRLSICGVDGVAHPERVRRHFGVVPQELALFDRLSAAENLSYFGRMYGLRGAALKEGVREGLRLAGLTERADAPVGSFSGGMKRRANLAAGILHRPPLLFLDEPTVGVDAQSRHLIMESLARLRDAGVAMVYTTHYMEEARRLFSRVAIIDRGKRLDCASPAALLQKYPDCADLDDLFLRLTGKQLRDG